MPQLSNLDGSWPSCPRNALPAAGGRSSAWHGTGLAGDRNRSWSQTAVAKQRSSALLCPSLSLKHVLRVPSAKSLCQGSPKLGCSFLQPAMAWQAWGAGVAGLRKDFISTGRSIKQKELGGKWTEWMIDVQRGLAFQGGQWEFPDRDIMPAWQGQATDVTHSSSAAFRTPECSTFYLTHLAGFGMCPCQS